MTSTKTQIILACVAMVCVSVARGQFFDPAGKYKPLMKDAKKMGSGLPLQEVSRKTKGYAKVPSPFSPFGPKAPIRFTVTEGRFPAKPYDDSTYAARIPTKQAKEETLKYIPFKRAVSLSHRDGSLDLVMSRGTFIPSKPGYYVFNFSAKCTSAPVTLEFSLRNKNNQCKLSLNKFTLGKEYKNLITLTIDEDQQASKEVTVYLFGEEREMIMLESDTGFPTQLEDVTFTGYKLNDGPFNM